MPAQPPSTDWQEDIAPDEDERFELHAETLREVQRKQSRKKGPGRALHRKSHAGVVAELEVLADLPDEVSAGLFAQPGRYDAYVRFSNGRQMHGPDTAPDLRGFAVKVLGVEGRKLIPGLEDASTQDFLSINEASQPFSNTDEFMRFVESVDNQLLALPRLMLAFGPVKTFRLLAELRSLAGPASIATIPFFSAVPVKWGDYAGKYAFFPQGVEGDPAKRGRAAGYLAEDLAKRLAAGPLRYEMKVQLFRDEQRTPIEDAAVEWKEDVAPFTTIATVVIPQQDVLGERGAKVRDFVEQLSFDPWHALEAHRPLGDIMRARNHAYRLSTIERNAAPEPQGVETFA
jgi:hypothetical protein